MRSTLGGGANAALPSVLTSTPSGAIGALVDMLELRLQQEIIQLRERSDPDANQKTETEFTFWYVLPYFVHSEPFLSKQKEKQVCTNRI